MNSSISFGNVRWDNPDYYGPLTETAILEKASQISVSNIEWLIPGWLAKGDEHVLAGRPACGKGFLVSALAARITNPENNHAWFPETRLSEAGRVVIVDKEDSAENVLAPRLMAAGADLDRVSIVQKIKTARGHVPINLAEHTDDLIDTLNRHQGIRLLVLDNLTSLYTRDGVKKAPSLMTVLARLKNLAAERSFALLIVTHLKKSAREKDPLANISGNLSIGSSPRLVMQVDCYADGETPTFVLARSKTSNWTNYGGYLYSIEGAEIEAADGRVQTARVSWIGTIEGSARTLLAPSKNTVEKLQRTGKREFACAFLRDFLRDGPKAKKDVVRAAAEQGIASATLERAAKSLFIASEKEKCAGQFSGFVWSLPEARDKGASSAAPPQTTLMDEVVTYLQHQECRTAIRNPEK